MLALVRSFISGGIATLADTLVLVALCTGAGLRPGLAAVAGCVTGGAVNFAIARAWVFRTRDRRWLASLVRYAVLVVGGGAVLSGIAIGALKGLGVGLLFAKGITIVLVQIAWTYPVSARAVFERRANVAAGPPARAHS